MPRRLRRADRYEIRSWFDAVAIIVKVLEGQHCCSRRTDCELENPVVETVGRVAVAASVYGARAGSYPVTQRQHGGCVRTCGDFSVVVVAEQDVERRDVAMHQPDHVGGVQRLRHLVHDPHRPCRRQPPAGEDRRASEALTRETAAARAGSEHEVR